MKSAVRIAVLILLFLIALMALFWYWSSYKLRPDLTGEVHLQALQHPAHITWSELGMPTMVVRNEYDAMVLTGYVHAQDRLWSMTLQQLKLQGRFSEYLDPSLVEKDRFYLSMGFGEAARKSYEALDSREQQLLQAYSEGVNAYIQAHRHRLPIEFTLTDMQPLLWKPWHSLGVQLLWSWSHHLSFWAKPSLYSLEHPTRAGIARLVHWPDTTAFTTMMPNEIPEPYATEIGLGEQIISFLGNQQPPITGTTGTGIAMATRRPPAQGMLIAMQATPPDRSLNWYELAVQVGDRYRSGMTLPGFPAILHGSNEYLHWSVQSVPMDDGDFFSGTLFDTQVSTPVNWHTDASLQAALSQSISLQRHILDLKDGTEVPLVTMRAFDRPIVSISESSNTYVAFDWTGLHPVANLDGWMALALARDRHALSEAASRFQTSPKQVLYATGSGDAGLLWGGWALQRERTLTMRTSGNLGQRVNLSGLIPDSLAEQDTPVMFSDRLPVDRLPEVSSTAFGMPWDLYEHAATLIDRHTQSSTVHAHRHPITRDVYSPFAASLVPLLVRELEAAGGEEKIRRILPYLQNWQFRYDPGITAASVFEQFLYHASRRLWSAYIDEHEQKLLFTTPHIALRAVSTAIQWPGLWPEELPFSRRDWMVQSMYDAIRDLETALGEEPHQWQWASLASYSFTNSLPFAAGGTGVTLRVASEQLFSLDVREISGSAHTLRKLYRSHTRQAPVIAVSSMIMESYSGFAHDGSALIIPGQSDNYFSEHYKDQLLLMNSERNQRRGRSTGDSESIERVSVQHFKNSLP